jgi:hypothetical protein
LKNILLKVPHILTSGDWIWVFQVHCISKIWTLEVLETHKKTAFLLSSLFSVLFLMCLACSLVGFTSSLHLRGRNWWLGHVSGAKQPNHLYNTLKKSPPVYSWTNLSVRTQLQTFTVNNRDYTLHTAVKFHVHTTVKYRLLSKCCISVTLLYYCSESHLFSFR